MRIGIIGAGAAGLCAIKNCISFDCQIIAFEQSDQIGGTWVYTENIGTDKYDNDIHSSMYKSLKTNLPKELMQFPDFPFPQQEKKSFISASEVNNYLNHYADVYKLRQFIKFQQHVIRVRPVNNDLWEVIVKSLLDGCHETYTFDAILVCNGHFSTPHIPKFEGKDIFRGEHIHSHSYRTPCSFTHRRVLIIGAGPSGVDITQEIAKVAGKVFWSNHLKPPKSFSEPNLIQKPDVSQFTREGAIFADGSFESFDVIVYCTGYRYTFPFLSVDCSISADDNYVRPLYKHCLNINYPTMALIGLPFYVCPFQMFDLQIRFCLTFMTRRKELPQKEEMLNDSKCEMRCRWKQGLTRNKAHALGIGRQDAYFAELATIAEIVPIKSVILKMYEMNRKNQNSDFENYRRYKFTVVDNENFEAKIPSI